MSKDTIYREDAIMALRLEYPMMPLFKSLREEWAIKTEGFRKAEEVIMKLPSVDTPTTATGIADAIREAEYRGYMKAVEDRPKGEWIEDPINKNIMHCSNCKVSYTKDFLRGMSLYHEPKDTPDFCPNCGADMREREGE